MLDNREIAIAIWLSLFAYCALRVPGVRSNCPGVLKALLNRQILSAFVLMASYVYGLVILLQMAGVWGIGDVKATILWTMTAAVVMVSEVESISSDPVFFRKAALDGFRISVFLEFIANLYVFNLIVELIFVPFVTLLVCIVVVADLNEENRSVSSVLNTILAVLGLGLLICAVHRIITDSEAFLRAQTLFEFLLPLLLTFLFLPFLYFLALYVCYATAFNRLKIFMNDTALRRYTRFQLILRFRLNLWGVSRWTPVFVRSRPDSKEAILVSIANVKSQVAHAESELK